MARKGRESIANTSLQNLPNFPQGAVECMLPNSGIQITRWPVASDHTGKHTFCCMIDRGGRFIIRRRAEVPGKLCNSFLLFLDRGSAFRVISPLHCYCNHKSRQLAAHVRVTRIRAGILKYKPLMGRDLATPKTFSASTWKASSSKKSSKDSGFQKQLLASLENVVLTDSEASGPLGSDTRKSWINSTHHKGKSLGNFLFYASNAILPACNNYVHWKFIMKPKEY